MWCVHVEAPSSPYLCTGESVLVGCPTWRLNQQHHLKAKKTKSAHVRPNRTHRYHLILMEIHCTKDITSDVILLILPRLLVARR